MALNLPDPDPARLSDAPLELVVCQIRIEPHPEMAEKEIAFRLHEAMGGESGAYPRLDPLQTQNIAFQMTAGEAEPAVERNVVSTGWTMKSADDNWVVSIVPEHVALETRAYTTWAGDFETRLGQLVAAVAEIIDPAVAQRIGLRYIDRIKELHLESVQAWEGFIRPEVLGPALHPGLRDGITATHQTIRIEAAPGVHVTMQHGTTGPDDRGAIDYVLDFDVARVQSRRFDAESISNDAAELNGIALQLFQASVTDELLERLR